MTFSMIIHNDDAVDADDPVEEQNSDPAVDSLHDGSETQVEVAHRPYLEVEAGVARTPGRNTRSRHFPPLLLAGRVLGLGSEVPRTLDPENWS